MTNIRRRTALKLLGASGLAFGAAGTASADDEDEDAEAQDHEGSVSGLDPEAAGEIFKLGQSLGSDPPGGFAEEDVRSDGEMALLGSFFGQGGSFLYDIRDPTEPTEVHRLPSSPQVRNADVAFDPREGLYYRSQEPNEDDVEFAGVEVVDYGFENGSVEDPIIVSTPENGGTHNLFPHPDPDTNLLYAARNDGPETFWIWDVSDPTSPEQVGSGPEGDLHDLVVDPERELGHLSGHDIDVGDDDVGNAAYVVMDWSDPADPEPVGWIDYDEYPDLQDVGFGDTLGFDDGNHYANYDPDRMISVISDETSSGFPAPKVTVDIGWDEGSPSDPQPLGFTWSPNAELMDELGESYDWTTHNHDIISKPDATLLVSGDYREGTVVYDITDPENPAPADRYRTDDMADEADGPTLFPEEDGPPMAWGANYNEERDLTVTSDMWTGLYVFTVTPTVGPGGDVEESETGDDGEDGDDD